MKHLAILVTVGLLVVFGACSKEQPPASDDAKVPDAKVPAADPAKRPTRAPSDPQAPAGELTHVELELPEMD